MNPQRQPKKPPVGIKISATGTGTYGNEIAYGGLTHVALEINRQEAAQEWFITQALIAGNEAVALSCVRRRFGAGECTNHPPNCCESCPQLNTGRKE
jgi:hypothetical protein